MSYTGAPGDPAQSQPDQPYPPAQPHPPVPYGPPVPGQWQPQAYPPGEQAHPPRGPAHPPYPPAGPFPYPPPPGWQQQKQMKSRTPWIIAGAVLLPILLLGGFCLWGIVKIGQTATDAGGVEDRVLPPESSAAPFGGLGEPSAEPSAVTGPRASTYPVREEDDLNRVCTGWYYPQSPKVAGKAPHQISIGVVSSADRRIRLHKHTLDVPDNRESVRKAWWPENAAKSRLMGCVEVESTGGKVASCKYDDPKPETVEMRQGRYHVRLYEVATGRKLLDKKVTGEDEECPLLVFLSEGEKLASQVGDRQLYELFRSFVMKK